MSSIALLAGYGRHAGVASHDAEMDAAISYQGALQKVKETVDE
jgi:hypothetical protein